MTVTDNETGRGGLTHAFDGHVVRGMLEIDNEGSWGRAPVYSLVDTAVGCTKRR